MIEKDKSVSIFLRCIIIGFILSSIKVDILGQPAMVILNDIFMVFMYNFICGILFGLSSMFGYDLYFGIKKSLKK